jgi:hypothetical protein
MPLLLGLALRVGDQNQQNPKWARSGTRMGFLVQKE